MKEKTTLTKPKKPKKPSKPKKKKVLERETTSGLLWEWNEEGKRIFGMGDKKTLSREEYEGGGEIAKKFEKLDEEFCELYNFGQEEWVGSAEDFEVDLASVKDWFSKVKNDYPEAKEDEVCFWSEQGVLFFHFSQKTKNLKQKQEEAEKEYSEKLKQYEKDMEQYEKDMVQYKTDMAHYEIELAKSKLRQLQDKKQ